MSRVPFYNRQKGMCFPHQKCRQFCHNHQPKSRTLCCLTYLLPPKIPSCPHKLMSAMSSHTLHPKVAQDVGAGFQRKGSNAPDALRRHVGGKAADRERAVRLAAGAGYGQRHAADAKLVFLIVNGIAAGAHLVQLGAQSRQIGHSAARQLLRVAVPPHILHLFFGQGSQDGFAHTGTVQRLRSPTRLDIRMGPLSVLYMYTISCASRMTRCTASPVRWARRSRCTLQRSSHPCC